MQVINAFGSSKKCAYSPLGDFGPIGLGVGPKYFSESSQVRLICTSDLKYLIMGL